MQVAVVRTPSTAPQVAAAIIAAYRDLTGRNPLSKSSWLWPLALAKNEVADFSRIRNNNIGNVTTSGSGGVDWFANPYVTAPLKFLSFATLRAGALSMLKALNRFEGVAAADAGDQVGWQHALDKYLGSPYPPPWGLVAELESTQPEGGYELISPPRSIRLNAPTVFAVTATLGMAAAAGYAAYRRREALS